MKNVKHENEKHISSKDTSFFEFITISFPYTQRANLQNQCFRGRNETLTPRVFFCADSIPAICFSIFVAHNAQNSIFGIQFEYQEFIENQI